MIKNIEEMRNILFKIKKIIGSQLMNSTNCKRNNLILNKEATHLG
jgi:hypothetical protein